MNANEHKSLNNHAIRSKQLTVKEAEGFTFLLTGSSNISMALTGTSLKPISYLAFICVHLRTFTSLENP
jgi:hypothetical protein